MNENNELGAGPLANEGTKGLPVVAWLSDFDALADRLEIAGWRSCADAQSDGVRALLAEWTEAIAQRDAELAELRADLIHAREAANELREALGGALDERDALQAELAAMCAASKPVQVDYVAVMRDNGEGGVEPEWTMEGGTAELMAGMYLCCVDGGALLFEEGSGELYAAPSQVTAEVVQVPRELLANFIEYSSVHRDGVQSLWQVNKDKLRALLATSQGEA